MSSCFSFSRFLFRRFLKDSTIPLVHDICCLLCILPPCPPHLDLKVFHLFCILCKNWIQCCAPSICPMYAPGLMWHWLKGQWVNLLRAKDLIQCKWHKYLKEWKSFKNWFLNSTFFFLDQIFSTRPSSLTF